MPTLSDLPVDILQILLRKLSCIKDVVVFGAVCSLWRSLVFQCRQHIPPLLMNPDTYFHDMHVFCFPTLCEHVLPTHMVFNPYGSSHGWLVIRRKPFPKNPPELFNPFSSVNNTIKLPFTRIHPLKVALSQYPFKTLNYIVVTFDSFYKLCFFKAGDKYWTPVDYDSNVDAIVYYRDRLYAIDCCGNLISCNINSTPQSVEKVASIPCYTLEYDSGLFELAGDLLCVDWYITHNFLTKKIQFRVWKVEHTKSKVLELDNLRGHAIFLSCNSLVAVSVSDFSSWKPDYIYFSIQDFIGAFNMIDKTFQPLDLPLFNPTTIWIQPTLNMIMTTTKFEGASHNSGLG